MTLQDLSVAPLPLVFVIGMPGAGKSYWSRRWAARGGWHFKDLDLKIEQTTRQSISELFARGEANFRLHEALALRKIIATAQPYTLVATGGGTAAYEDNMHCMLSSGLVVWLDASIEQLLSNLEQSGTERPLLGGDQRATIESLLRHRLPYYQEADLRIDAAPTADGALDAIFAACTRRQ